ncbi:hypothetical protein WICPIJ_007621 [Wickerhamomyces pijperi]|uniref:Uncharacterized protein n=1 Tax=Wickerhamomyces pijperi TaxID=599730 RepID=A0A9P8Q1E6_WICPI|nr:hypothetical protein WICPIJ_007621 [Wickerhamomyces pijperi]
MERGDRFCVTYSATAFLLESDNDLINFLLGDREGWGENSVDTQVTVNGTSTSQRPDTVVVEFLEELTVEVVRDFEWLLGGLVLDELNTPETTSTSDVTDELGVNGSQLFT